jgi:2-methylcitrate dehydratase PrpD
MEMYGTSMQKRINPGPAARNGVTAATLAGMGFTGAETIFEGERGFGAAFTDKFDAARLLDGLGDNIPVLVEYKPYSAARPIHNAIDCALRIRAESGIGVADIDSITVWRHPMWAKYHVINSPRTYHEAQVSLPYSVAVAFSDGRALPEQYEDRRVGGDRELAALSSRVRILADEGLSRPVSCRLSVRTYDGRELSATVDYPKGSIEDPLSDQELLAKFSYLTEPVLGTDKSRRLAEAALAVGRMGDINDLLALTHR